MVRLKRKLNYEYETILHFVVSGWRSTEGIGAIADETANRPRSKCLPSSDGGKCRNVWWYLRDEKIHRLKRVEECVGQLRYNPCVSRQKEAPSHSKIHKLLSFAMRFESPSIRWTELFFFSCWPAEQVTSNIDAIMLHQLATVCCAWGSCWAIGLQNHKRSGVQRWVRCGPSLHKVPHTSTKKELHSFCTENGRPGYVYEWNYARWWNCCP